MLLPFYFVIFGNVIREEEPGGKVMQMITAELRQAMAVKKCWRCGCFHDTVTALQDSAAINAPLGVLLDEARMLFETKRYDCLGCED